MLENTQQRSTVRRTNAGHGRGTPRRAEGQSLGPVRQWRRRGQTGAKLALVLGLAARFAAAAPFVPVHDSDVLERLPSPATAAEARTLRQQREPSTREPLLLPDAVALGRRFIELSRSESDPRFVGRAKALLEPWWNSPAPPIDVLILRATIRQSGHDFAGALSDLERVIALDPTQAQAWLTRATILQVTGDYDAARQAAARLATLGPPLAAVTCAAQLASLTGAAVQAYATLLRAVLLDRTRAETTEGLWSLTVLAEIAARLGRNAEAEQHLRSALALGPRDGCVLGAYADLLLDQRRFCDVTSLLRNEAGADALLLRRALAAQEALSTGAEPGAAQALARELERRFNAAHQRGDTTHRREEARYRLHLGGQPRAALTLALENWASQKEPADARLVLECALAANDPDAADAVRAFIRRTRLQDVQLAALEKRFP